MPGATGAPRPARRWSSGASGPRSRGARAGPEAHWKVTATPSVRFDVTDGFASRYQAWKLQVSPAAATTNPVGLGRAFRKIIQKILAFCVFFKFKPSILCFLFCAFSFFYFLLILFQMTL